MCTYNVKIDDSVVDRVRPHFDGDASMQSWIEEVLKKAMMDYAERLESSHIRNRHSQELLRKLEELKDDPDAFFKMGGILGQPKAEESWNELREEALYEKYGV